MRTKMSIVELKCTIPSVQEVVYAWDVPYKRGWLWQESHTRQVTVDPILRALGWNTSDPRECYPEWRYGDGGRVDYALFSNYDAADIADGTAVPCIIIEVKPRGVRPSHDVGILTVDDLNQLQSYVNADTRMEEGLAVLTNGTQWYIRQLQDGRPLEKIDPIPVDILYDDLEDVADVLDQYMGRQNW